MVRRFTRREIQERLQDTLSQRVPIIAAGCSAGIIAKCAELGGADLIMVYSSGRARLRGLQTALEEDSNTITLDMFEEIQNVVQNTPIVAGIDAMEPPAGSDLGALVQKFLNTGFSGVINFPTYGFFNDEEWRRKREEDGIGFSREVELIRTAQAMDVFTMAYAFFPEDARAMAEAGVHCMIAHAGGTAGGLVGFDSMASPLEETAALVQGIISETRTVNAHILCLAHGGPIATPEDTRYIYEHTDAVGFVGASSIERIPIERAVTSVVEEFKAVALKGRER